MPKFSANLTFLYTDVPLLDRFAAAARAGFKGVEYMSPYEETKADLVARLRDNGLTQVLHNLPAGNWGAGERGIAIFPDRVEEFRRGVAQAIDYATALGCRLVNCIVGLAPAGADKATLHKTLVGNLAFAARELDQAKIKLLIEPINTRDMPGFFLNRTDQAARLIAEVGSDNLYIQYDAYHMQIMEGDLTRTIDDNLPRMPMSSSPTTPAVMSRAPARSTIPSCSAISTRSAIPDGWAANTSR